MEIIAHRGFWKTTSEMNTQLAFRRALDYGFGIETDIRDFGGRLVISHNPPIGDALSAEIFFDLVRSHVGGVIAINVKSDGLSGLLSHVTAGLAPERHFVFDMSIPDTLCHFETSLPVFVRFSELEQPGSLLLSRAAGVWLDAVYSEWYSRNTILSFQRMGLSVCLVSPELHRRPYQAEWNRLREWGVFTDKHFFLCTDFPDKAKDFFK